MIFTVIIPTRNRVGMLSRAIQSVVQQTFKDWELIIVDDASDDETEKTIRPLISGKIRYVRNEECQGPAASRNVGIKHSSHQTMFISLLDDDDVYFPGFLERTFAALKDTSEEIGFSWTGVENHYTKTNRSEKFFWDPPFSTRDQAFNGFLEKRLIGTGYGITFKKVVFDKIGFFDETLRAVEDTDFFLRTLKRFFYVKIPDTLIRITRHHENHVNTDSIAKAEGLTVIYNKHKDEILRNNIAWYNFKAKISSIYYRLGQRKTGRRLLMNSFKEKSDLKILILLLRLELIR